MLNTPLCPEFHSGTDGHFILTYPAVRQAVTIPVRIQAKDNHGVAMALRCETCGAENPAINRFCGQCGKQLVRAASDAPEEFWRDINYEPSSNHLEASADLPPEVIDFDTRIPLIAENGTDRRLHTPPELVEEMHDHLEREAELHDQQAHGNETHFSVHRKAEGLDFLHWDMTGAPPDAQAETEANGEEFHLAPSQPATDVQHGISEGENLHRTGVSGPSFLGLTDDQPTEYAYEDDIPESHLRRNIAVGITAAVVLLVALQWRSIRDYGLTYMQNGTMEVKQLKETPKAPPAVAADNASRDLGQLSPATPTPDAPKPIQSSPNANHALPVQEADNTKAPTPPNRTQPSAMSSPTPEIPQNHTVVRHPIAKLKPLHTKPAVHSVAPRSAPGSEELSRAEKAIDSEARAAWLWKAVGKGNPQAPVELAKMYAQGNGVVRSCDQAQVLLRSAAAKGNEQAKLNLQQFRAHGNCSVR